MVINSTNIRKTLKAKRPRHVTLAGADPGFQVRGGAHLKKIAPSGGRRENVWSISCEKSRFYAKKSYFFQLRGEARKFLRYFVWKITILRQKIIFFSNFRGGSTPGWKSRSWLGTDTNMWWFNTPLLITGSLTAMNIHVCWFFILSPLLFYLCSFHFWNWTLKRHQRCLLI